MPNNTIDSLEIEVKEVGFTGKRLDNVAKSLTALKNSISEFASASNVGIQKLRSLATSIQALNDAGKGGGISKIASDLSKLNKINLNKISKVPTQLQEIDTMLADRGSVIETGTFDSGYQQQISFLDSLKAKANEAGKSFDKFFGSVKRIAMYRLIRSTIKAITTAMSEGVNNAYQWSKAFGGQFAQSMDRIATSTNYLKNSLGALSIPIFNALAPVLDAIIDKVVEVINAFSKLFAYLSGSGTWTRAVKGATEFASASGNAAKQMKSLIGGFDEINNIGGQAQGGASAGSSGDIKFIQEQMSKFTLPEKFNITIGVIGAAAALASLAGLKDLAGGLMGIGLIAIGVKLEFEGILSYINDGDLSGETFTKLILGALGLAGGGTLLASKISSALGSALIGGIVGGITSAIAGIPLIFIGIWDAIKNGLNWLNGILIPTGTTITGAGIGAIIGSLGGPIGAGIGALIGLAVGLVTDGIIAIVQHWDDIVNWWNESAMPWLNELGTSIGTWFSNLGKGIADWFSQKWNDLKTWFNNIKTTLGNFFSTTISNVVSFFSNLGNQIYSKMKNIINNYLINPINKVVGWINDKLHIKIPSISIFGFKLTDAIDKQLFTIPSLPSLDTGTNYVPKDTLAMIHQGEAVVPKEFNEQEFFGNNEETNELLRTLIKVVEDKNMSVNIDDNSIGKSAVKYINRQNRVMGGSIV